MSNLSQRSDGTGLFTGMGVEWYSFSFTSAGNFTAVTTNPIVVDLQLIGIKGAPIAKQIIVEALSLLDEDPLTTQTVHPAFATTFTVQTNGFVLKATTATSRLLCATSLAGLLTFTVTSTTSTRRIGIKMPDGTLKLSPTLTWTA